MTGEELKQEWDRLKLEIILSRLESNLRLDLMKLELDRVERKLY